MFKLRPFCLLRLLSFKISCPTGRLHRKACVSVSKHKLLSQTKDKQKIELAYSFWHFIKSFDGLCCTTSNVFSELLSFEKFTE